MPNKKKVKITLIRSANGTSKNHKLCVKGLGLRKINQSITLSDDSCIRGLIKKVAYLLLVEEV
jgi:large subunit ribosomal protein L30